MGKYYFGIEGISMELEDDDVANEMCMELESILQGIGIKEADVYFSTEEDFKKGI